jgi:O-antigen biosynthesis protein
MTIRSYFRQLVDKRSLGRRVIRTERHNLANEVALARTSGLFDADYYLRQWPDLAAVRCDPIEHYLKEGWHHNSDPGPDFSTGCYLGINGDVRAKGVNPLIHYIKYGRREGRQSVPSRRRDEINRERPIAPTSEHWNRLTEAWRSSSTVPLVDVIVPVFRGFDETMRCLFSVLTAKQHTPYQLIIVDDCGPDTRLREQIQELAAHGLLELHRTPKNVGFVGACNLGMALNSERDVVLLNSDTEVFGDWLDRLRTAALRQPRTGTVTPLSNNAEICSYPNFVQANWLPLEVGDEIIDQIAARANADSEVELPTGVGFCMYIRRSCLDEIGPFDVDNFGIGYGEENDFCRRAISAGWRNILAPNVYVRHHGAASFGEKKAARVRAALDTIERLHPGYLRTIDDFIRADPVRPFREALDIARLANRAGAGATLFVTHTWGGGTERHVQDMARILEAEGVPAFFCRVSARNPKLIQIEDLATRETPNVSFFDMARDLDRFVEVLHRIGVFHIHVQHLGGFPESAPDFFRAACHAAGIPYDVTIHDYMFVCPRINMIDRSGFYCGEPGLRTCETCVEKSGSPFGNPSVWEWRERYGRLLLSARRVFVPHDDVARRMRRFFPEVGFIVRPHPESIPNPTSTTEVVGIHSPHATGCPRPGRVRRVAVLGAIGPHKGAGLLADAARAARDQGLPLEFVVVGYTDRDEELRAIGNVGISGRFEEGEAVQRLAAAGADVAWFPAVWPETYSYTLSAALQARVFPAAFDLGAIASRIRAAGWGELMPPEHMLDPNVIARRLAMMPVSPPPDGGAHLFASPAYADPLESYYELRKLPNPVTSARATL